MRPALFCLAALFPAVAMFASAQQPVVEHAEVETLSAAHDPVARLAELERSRQPLWLGYTLEQPQGLHFGSDRGQVEYLEGNGPATRWKGPHEDEYHEMRILLRVADGQVTKLRLATPDRTLDGGGLRFVWMTDVSTDESLKLMSSVVRANLRSNGPEPVRNDAVFFISLHQSPGTTPLMEELAGPGNDADVREKAAFWMATNRGHEGFVALQKLARQDDDAALREKLAFDFSMCKDEPAAADELIRMAKDDSAPGVRRQAQFWMAKLGGDKVTKSLDESAEHDPNADVRQHAVFAVSQLPRDEATTGLIQLARTSPHPEVRQQAVFWLGQSNDPRALDYLTELLKN